MRLLLPLLLLLCAAARGPAQELPANGPAKLEVELVSLNVWGLPWTPRLEERVARLGQELARLRPQVVCLQEVWREEDGVALTKALAGAGLPHARHWKEGFLGSGLLVASAWPLREVTFRPFDLAGKAHKPWHGDWYATKAVALVSLETPLGPLQVATTHLHARYGSDEYLPLQVTQAEELVRAIGDHGAVPPPPGWEPGRPPLVLAGDLNSPRDALPWRLIAAGGALRAPDDDLGIDWVFVRDGGALRVELRSVSALFEGPLDLGGGERVALSDHAGRLAKLTLRRIPRQAPASPGADPRPRWRAVAGEAEEQLAAARDAALARSGSARGRGVWLLLVSGLLFALARKLKRKLGCLLGLGSFLLLHLATVQVYLGAISERSLAAGLERARARLEARLDETREEGGR